jgi:hypothetical protein
MKRLPLMKCFKLRTKNVRHQEITKIRTNLACTYLKHLKISQVIKILEENLFPQRAYIFQKKEVVVETVPLNFHSSQNFTISKNRNNNNRRNFKIMEIY